MLQAVATDDHVEHRGRAFRLGEKERKGRVTLPGLVKQLPRETHADDCACGQLLGKKSRTIAPPASPVSYLHPSCSQERPLRLGEVA
jgi:hypothetical protein